RARSPTTTRARCSSWAWPGRSSSRSGPVRPRSTAKARPPVPDACLHPCVADGLFLYPQRRTGLGGAMTEEHTDAYRELRLRVTALMADVDDETMASPSPATPEWTVHDVLAHLVGVTDDVVNGRLDGIATDEWTQKQVDAR